MNEQLPYRLMFPEESWRRSTRRDRSSGNNVLAIWLAVFVAAAPIPFGSNQPFIWCLSAAVLGLTALVYFGSRTSPQRGIAAPAGQMGVEVTLWLALCLCLAAQLLPFGPLTPATFLLPSGEVIVSPQLSLTPGATFLMLIQMAGYGLLYVLMAQVSRNRRRARWMLQASFFVVAGFAVWGLLSLTQFGDTILGLEKWAYQGSATATFVNRNSFATYLSLGLVCGAGLLAARHSSDGARGEAGMLLGPALVLAGMFVIVAALVATQSRMGLLAGSAGTLAVAILWASRQRRKLTAFAAVLGIAALVSLCALWLYGGGVSERLGSTETDFDVRADLYRQVWQMITARPLLGYGGGSFEFAFPLFHHAPVSADLSWDKAHSTYLALWADLGLVAGSLPLLVVAVVLMRSLSAHMTGSGNSANNLAAIGAIVVCAVHSTVDFSLEIQAVAYLFAAILGMNALPAAPVRRAEPVPVNPTAGSW